MDLSPEQRHEVHPEKDVSLAQAGWLTGWQYRKSHTITGSAGAGTDYQVRITVHRTTGTDLNESVYVGTNCKTDFGDIRFTDDDGVTLLDYWMEESDSSSASFWVEIKQSLDSDVDIFFYYGNSAATSISNGSATFIVFDDFDNGYLAGDFPKAENGWNQTSSSDVYIQPNPSGRSGMGLRLNNTESQDYETAVIDWTPKGYDSIAIHYEWYVDRIVNRNGYTVLWGNPYETIASRGFTTGWQGLDGVSRHYTKGTTGGNEFTPVYDYSAGVWHEVVDYVARNHFHSTMDGNSYAGEAQNTDVGNFSKFLVETYLDNRNGDWFSQYDDFFVTKWIEAEPTHSSWGSEESQTGLVASWSFNEGSGTTLSDSSGNGNDGTINGATWTQGVYDGALSFDGSNDYVQIPTIASFSSITNEMTFETLIRQESRGSELGCAIFMMDAGTPENILVIGSHSISPYGFNYVDWDGSHDFDYAPPLNIWVLLTIVLHLNGDLELWLNGTLRQTMTGLSSLRTDILDGVYLGTDIDIATPSDFYHGMMDEVRIYNRSLSAAEIQQHYNDFFSIATTTTTTTTDTTSATSTDTSTTGPSTSPADPMSPFIPLLGLAGVISVVVIGSIVYSQKKKGPSPRPEPTRRPPPTTSEPPPRRVPQEVPASQATRTSPPAVVAASTSSAPRVIERSTSYPVTRGPIEIASGFDAVGENLKLAVKVKNNGRLIITDVKVVLDVPNALEFVRDTSSTQDLGNISSGEAQSAIFWLRPTRCIDGEYGGTILYRNASGEKKVEDIPPKRLVNICPMLTSTERADEVFARLKAGSLARNCASFEFSGGARAVLKMAETRLSGLTPVDHSEHEYEDGVYLGYSYYVGETKYGEHQFAAEIQVSGTPTGGVLTLSVYSDDERILSGFFVDVMHDVRQHIEIVQERMCPVATCSKCGGNIDLSKVGEDRVYKCDYCGTMGKASPWL